MAEIADFRLEYPDFVGVDDTVVQYYLDKAASLTNFERCPQYDPYMQIALAAHLLTKSQHNPEGAIDDAPSPALQQKVGDVSVSYGYIRSERDFSSSDAWYGSTPYGKEFMMYRNKCFQSGATVAP
jgi:hypothetical protein